MNPEVTQVAGSSTIGEWTMYVVVVPFYDIELPLFRLVAAPAIIPRFNLIVVLSRVMKLALY